MYGLVQGRGPCTFETNWEIAQFRVSPAPDQSPASEVRLRKSGFPRIVGSGSKVPNRNRKGLSNPTVWVWPPGSYIGTILNVYAAAGSTRTNDFIDNSRPCDHNRKLCESSHITHKFVTYLSCLSCILQQCVFEL